MPLLRSRLSSIDLQNPHLFVFSLAAPRTDISDNMGLLTDSVFQKRESWGYVYILLIRGSSWTTWVFLSVAILKLANNSVDCSAKGFEMGWNATMNRTQTEDEANMYEIDVSVGGYEKNDKIMIPQPKPPVPQTRSPSVLTRLISSGRR